MIFVCDFPITKILFMKIKTKTRLPCDNLAHAYNIHNTNPFIFAYDGLIQVFQALQSPSVT